MISIIGQPDKRFDYQQGAKIFIYKDIVYDDLSSNKEPHHIIIWFDNGWGSQPAYKVKIYNHGQTVWINNTEYVNLP